MSKTSDSPTPERPSLGLRRLFTNGTHPFKTMQWERRDALIDGPDGTPVFEQRDVSFPADWSQNATNIVAQKYFAGGLGTEGREYSVKQMIGRVVEKIGAEGLKHGYFQDPEEREIFEHELAYILVHQMAAFNSPVWFNIGVDGVDQQCSACFILHVEDSLEEITRWYAEEAKIFQNGSGAGLNLSQLRSSTEPLSRGGKSSGPVTFMRAADASAGTITSGGRCLAPGQRVYTAAGPVPVRELAERGQDFVVFSYDPPAGRYKAKTARAWKQPFQKQLVEVRTDKGSFQLSADHPVKLSSGEYLPAGQLRAGQSLFAGTIHQAADGYLRLGLKDGRKTKERLHRLVAQDILGAAIDGMSVHHRNGDKLDNRPENLEVVTQAEHAALHGKQAAANGEHLFQQRSFPQYGTDNPMHSGAAFWKDAARVEGYKAKQAAILLADPQRSAEMQQAAARQKMLNTAFRILNAGYSIDTFDEYVRGRKQVIGRIPSINQLESKITERFGSYQAFVQEVAAQNHRVLEMLPLGISDVYDVEVDCPTPDDKTAASGHNFLIWDGEQRDGSGIVISNTRRAAKMVVLDVDHPDVEDFIWCKAEEEKKARALAAAGFDMSLNTPEGERNWASIQYQNANNSVRLPDAFMKAVEKDADWQLTARSTGEPSKTVKARELLAQIADAAWECADPGVQFDTTINSWHTCPNHSRITASNPCCFVGETLIDTAEGRMRIDELVKRSAAGQPLPLVFAWDREQRLPVLRQILKGWKAGEAQQLIEVVTDKGITLRCTPEHRFLLHDGSYVEARELQAGTRLRKIGRFVNAQRSHRHYLNHRVTAGAPSGTSNQARWMWEQAHGPIPAGYEVHHLNGDATDDRLSNLALQERSAHRQSHSSGSNNPRFMEVEPQLLVSVYEEIEATAVKGRLLPVTPARWNNHLRREGLVGAVPMAQSPTTGGRIQGQDWQEFCQWIDGHRALVNDRVASVRVLEQSTPVAVYDLEVEGVQNFAVTSGDNVHSVVVHNSEYMHVDNSSCNLASLNLMKFRTEDGTLDSDAFRHAVQVLFTAQEILIAFADYPTQAIGENTRAMRQIGLGYANLGAYLMASGLPYDSAAGRQVAASITALMHCEAYAQSARIAERMGPYQEYAANADAQLRVLRRHRSAANKLEAWDGDLELTRAAKRTAKEMVTLAEAHGVRNAQATVLAPTGTISFLMDCDTTGIEPDFSLVKYKKLVGGGAMTIVNQTVPQALSRLGYEPGQINEIVEFIREHNTVAGAPHLQEEHLPVFDTAVGARAISYQGHLQMMAAVQPFISGAISKTVNLPADITKQDIFDLYLEAWKMGLKAVAIYRDGTKTAQPLGGSEDDEENLVTSLLGDGLLRGQRRRVPDDGQAIKRRFEINSATSGKVSGHIVVGLFEDGTPGELFVNVSQAGSTLRGFIDTWSRLFSMALQYGAPLEDLIAKQVFTQFEPAGFTNDREIARAKSIPDYVVRWMAARFLDADTHFMLGINSEQTEVVADEDDVELDAQRVQPRVKVHKGAVHPAAAPRKQESITLAGTGTCARCGGLMVQTGKCMTCTDCGETGGCG